MMTFVGIVAGIFCSFPMLYILGASLKHPGRIGIGPLIVCCLLPYMLLQVLIFCIDYVSNNAFVLENNTLAAEFGIASSLSFLASVVLIVLLSRPWHRK